MHASHQISLLNFSILLQHVTPHRITLMVILVLLLLESLMSLASPWLAGQLTGLVLGEPGVVFSGIGAVLLTWFALLLAKSLLSFFSSYWVASTGVSMTAQLRTRVHEHLQYLPLAYFNEQRPGDLLTLLSNDAEIISDFVTSTLIELLPLVLTFAGAFIIMFWLDPLIALLAATLLPVYYLAMKLIGRRIRPLAEQWVESWSGLMSLVQENLGLFPTIKTFIREPEEQQRFAARNARLLTLSKQQILIRSILSPAVGLLAGAALLLLLWVGFQHVEQGRIQASDLVSLLLYAALLTQPMAGLANVYGKVMLTRGAAERLLAFFNVQAEPQADTGKHLGKIQGDIEFRDISFSYPGRPALFHDFNLQIAAGETIAITGPNGAGKSTLTHLLMRFVEPTSGQVLIDGTDAASISLRSLRDNIGLVAQNTLLLNASIRENIAYGVPGASMSDIKKAAVAARADEFISALPQQYDTVIGEQGIRLSGGQRQRISLARTLIKNPAILILDEATALFDPEGENSFIAGCHELLTQRTVILITHRPASLALADRVVHLPAGQAVKSTP